MTCFSFLFFLGWDPATGLGMPKFEEMLALVLGEGLDEGDA